MTRPLLALALTLPLISLAAQPAGAAYLSFLPASLSSPPVSITFGADGSLSGTIPISAILGTDTVLHPGQPVAIDSGVATFNLGRPETVDTGLYIYKGGSLTITGILPGGPAGGSGASPITLFSTAFLPCELSNVGPGPDTWLTTTIQGAPVVSEDVLSLFGVPEEAPWGRVGFDLFMIGFTGAPGGPVVVTSAVAGVSVAGVPEPAGAVMVAMGMAGVGVMGWGSRKRGR